eukprot:193049-Prorocentrum_minimum.AAC.3
MRRVECDGGRPPSPAGPQLLAGVHPAVYCVAAPGCRPPSPRRISTRPHRSKEDVHDGRPLVERGRSTPAQRGIARRGGVQVCPPGGGAVL